MSSKRIFGWLIRIIFGISLNDFSEHCFTKVVGVSAFLDEDSVDIDGTEELLELNGLD